MGCVQNNKQPSDPSRISFNITMANNQIIASQIHEEDKAEFMNELQQLCKKYELKATPNQYSKIGPQEAPESDDDTHILNPNNDQAQARLIVSDGFHPIYICTHFSRHCADYYVLFRT
eukprot:1001167_1